MKPLHSGAEAFRQIERVRRHTDLSIEATVSEILKDVRERGDAALLDSARRFDAPGLADLHVSARELEEAQLPRHQFEAIRTAIHRVRHFHLTQMEVLLGGTYDFTIHGIKDLLEVGAPRPGIAARWAMGREPSRLEGRSPIGREFGLGQMIRSADAAGIYVPGGGATYPSSVIMNAVPATIALVPRIVVTTPARPDGTLAPAVLVALREVGVDSAIKIGGAAAIAALALGTETIARVDTIAGPGNRFVNEAKRQLWGKVGVDGLAGPSEVLVIADRDANVEHAAYDLLTQIEHAPDNLGFVIAEDEATARAIEHTCERLILEAPRRDVLQKSFAETTFLLSSDSAATIDLANAVAAEHVSLAVSRPERYIQGLRHAGAIVLGRTPESAGDFVAGPSHTLPTGGAARWSSPVNAFTFLRFQSVIGLSDEEIRELGPAIAAFGEMEGLPLHGDAGSQRPDAPRTHSPRD